MEVATIRVGRRTATGTNRVSLLRARALIPAILYGGSETPVNLAVEEREMERHLRHHQKVYNLALDGGAVPVYLQEVQWDVLSERLLHMDFLRIDMAKPIQTDVELAYIGHPVGASHGGSLVRDRISLRISCLPGEIPEEIEVHVAELDIGDTLLAGKLILPPGVTTEVPADQIICHVAAGSASEAEPEAEAPGEAPPEEGGEGAESPKPKGE